MSSDLHTPTSGQPWTPALGAFPVQAVLEAPGDRELPPRPWTEGAGGRGGRGGRGVRGDGGCGRGAVITPHHF